MVEVFNTPQLFLPRRDRCGAVRWKAPRVAALLAMLTHPASAGAFPSGRTRPRRREASARPASTRLPHEPWRVCIPDVSPPSMRWDTSLQMQTRLTDNHAESARKKTRGIPRPGTALVHGRVSCGACGHTMVVQEKGGTRDLCHSLRQQYRTPVWQYMTADPGETRVVDALFQALAPVARAVSAQALATRQQQAERLATAQAQHRARVRSAAASGARPFHHVDPAHRHVAAALEHAWEVALQALTQAEAAEQQRPQANTPPAQAFPPALQAAFRTIGQTRPARWPTDVLSQAQRTALLRWLLDKVVLQRARRDQMHTRSVWRGGETTTCAVPLVVGALADLPGAPEMAPQLRVLFAAGTRDDEMARQLTPPGDRSPRQPTVLPSTVQGIRRTLGLMQHRSPSHPRRGAGVLTVPQRAAALGVTPHWGYPQSTRGTVVIRRDAQTRLSLFPDGAETLEAFAPLRAGHLSGLRSCAVSCCGSLPHGNRLQGKTPARKEWICCYSQDYQHDL